MKLVLDSNCLRDPQTRKYLAASTDNHVVLTDYLGMELYKSSSLSMLADLLHQVAEFPQQVIILKGTREVCQLNDPPLGATGALIDRRATSEFPDFCRWLATQGAENSPIPNHFHASAASAASHLDEMSAVFAGIQVDIAQVANELPPLGLRQLRTRQPLSAEMGRHLQRDIYTMAGIFFRAHGIAHPGETVPEYGHRFPFRYAVVAYIMALDWIATGGAVGKSGDKLRNDAVDSILVTYATYFDGVLSHDKKLNELSAEADQAFERLFGVKVGPM